MGQVTEADLRKSDSTGWIPINVSDISGFSMPTLPVDPQNTLNDNLYYTFYCNPQQEYILTSYMESKTFGPKGGQDSKTIGDGGPDPYVYEVGNNLFISPLKPVGSWSFDEGTGNIANDSSGNDNNGTLISGPTWADGQINKALSFDGVDDCVQVNYNSTLDIKNAITLETWFYRNAAYSIQADIHILSRSPSWFFYDSYDQGVFRGDVYINGTRYGICTNFFPSYTWQHVVFTYDSNTHWLKIYRNGVLENSRQLSDLSNYLIDSSTSYIRIGRASQSKSNIVDEPRIYNRVLSAEEIERHYEMSK